MTEKGSDPIALWQKMIGEMNAFASRTMTSPEFSKAMNHAGGVSAGAQKQMGEFMERYLVNMNLPSRAQMADVAARLQIVETQLNEIKVMLQQMNMAAPKAGVAAAPRPPRARRPAAPPSSGEKT